MPWWGEGWAAEGVTCVVQNASTLMLCSAKHRVHRLLQLCHVLQRVIVHRADADQPVVDVVQAIHCARKPQRVHVSVSNLRGGGRRWSVNARSRASETPPPDARILRARRDKRRRAGM